MVLFKKLLLSSILFLVYTLSFPQDKDAFFHADELHKNYQFRKAIEVYKSILSSSTDSISIITAREKILQCENGINLLQYSSTPEIITDSTFSVKDFYTYIPYIKNSWLKSPSPFTNGKDHPFYSAVLLPDNSTKIIYSAPDEKGSWNLYQSFLINNQIWSVPTLLNDLITSTGDEIFPMISSNGKELFFASNGHYGMGGYDLYVSRWDDEKNDWGTPENLGFPYSSTEDDIFYMNTPDGFYSIIGTNRECNKDSIRLVVTKYAPTTIKKSLKDLSIIKNISSFKIIDSFTKQKELGLNEIIHDDKNGNSNYSILVTEMKKQQKELDILFNKQKENRELYNSTENEEDRAFLVGIITDLEKQSSDLKIQLNNTKKRVQEAELTFLKQGIIPVYEEPEKNAIKNDQNKVSFKFEKTEYSLNSNITIEEPKPVIDYSFQILERAKIMDNDTLSKGLIYQIQLFVVANKAHIRYLKGLSPVFEKKQPSGKYLYNVGLFNKHSEALSNLKKVKSMGFPNSYIVAYNNGKSISIKTAKSLETSTVSTQQVIIGGYQDGLPESIITAIRGASDKDIARSVVNNKVIYIIGPFTEKSESEYLKKILSDLGVKDITIEQIVK